MARYCNKKGVAISESQWRELCEDYEYTFFGEYENDKLLVECLWSGRVDAKAHEMFWQPFSVIIWHRFNEKWVEEPESHAFGDEYDARDFYENYLDKHTECYFDKRLEQLVEVDNIASERRTKAIALQRERQAAKEKFLIDKAIQKQAKLDLIAEAKAKIEKEKADELRMTAELEELARIAGRDDSYGGW